MTEDWRTEEALKLVRQCRTCPLCGAYVCTDVGTQYHIAWHQNLLNYVGDVDENFQTIDTYVRGPGGLEEQITAAIALLRSDATAGIASVRADATAAINQLRADITAAIAQDRARLDSIEARLTALHG